MRLVFATAIAAIAGLAVVTPLAGCGDEPVEEVSPIAREVLDSISETFDPCTDFYSYACGGWIRTTAEKFAYNNRFIEAGDRTYEILHQLLDDAAARQRALEGDALRMARFYSACNDELALEENAQTTLAPMLELVDRVNDETTLMESLGGLWKYGVRGFFGLGVTSAPTNADKYIVSFSSGGLSLPDQSYYFPEDDFGRDLLDEYRVHVRAMLTLISSNPDAAEDVVALEAQLAAITPAIVDRRDPKFAVHEIGLSGLEMLSPLPWRTMLFAAGIPAQEEANVAFPEYFEQLTAIVRGADPAVIRAYLRWRVLHAYAIDLPAAFRAEDFRFYEQILQGRGSPSPRWRVCVAQTSAFFGDALGRAYIESELSTESTDVARAMFARVHQATGRALSSAPWLDEMTRAESLEKLGKIDRQVSHPEQWDTYEYLNPGLKHNENLLAAVLASQALAAGLVGQPIDRDSFIGEAHTVNAFYSATRNAVSFPAGILQKPFFDAQYPAAMRYGGIGAIMGHELTHAFDSHGRQFDGDGRLVDWWQPETAMKFEERAMCIEDLYSTFTVGELNVNGELTREENIADIGGLKNAFAAYRDEVAANGDQPPLHSTITNEQLFFLAFAQSRCVVQPAALLRLRVMVDEHAPDRFRVNGSVLSMPEFAEAFSCPADSLMNPPQRCELW